MTVSSSTSRADYDGNGVTVAFTVPFYFLDESHLAVYSTDTSAGVTTALAITTDYTVTGAGSGSGGTVTLAAAPAVGKQITVLRNVPLNQLTRYVENSPFPARSHENALDKLTMVVQQQQELIDRALKLPVAEDGAGELPTAADRLDHMLGFNSATGAPELTAFTQTEVASAIAAAYLGGAATSLDAVAFVQSGAGAVPRTAQTKLRAIGVSPDDKGAVADGVADDSTPLTNANSNNGRVLCETGKTYRISTNTTLGTLIPNGATISIDSGITLTVDEVQAGNEVAFSGAGAVHIKCMYYNLAWFAGATANAKFDFLRRGLETNRQWTLYIPNPKKGDAAAAHLPGFGNDGWAQTAPLIFGDPENNCIIEQDGFLIATAVMTSQIQLGDISGAKKTESIRAPKGLKVYGDGKATYGVYMPAAGHVVIPYIESHKHETALCIEGGVLSAISLNDISVGKVLSAYLTGPMVDIFCRAGGLVDAVSIDEVHFDGALTNTVDSIVRVRGIVRGMEIGTVRDEASIGNGLFDVTGRMVDIDTFPSATRSPEGIRVRNIYWNISTGVPPTALTVRNTAGTGEPDPKNIVCDANLARVDPSGPAFDLQVGSELQVTGRDAGKKVDVGATCTEVYLHDFRENDVTIADTASNVRVNGRFKRTLVVASGAATSIPIHSAIQGGIMVNLTSIDGANTSRGMVAFFRCGAVPAATKVGGSVDVAVTTGALTGTTGTNLNITVSAANGLLYVENRMAGTETITIEF